MFYSIQIVPKRVIFKRSKVGVLFYKQIHHTKYCTLLCSPMSNQVWQGIAYTVGGWNPAASITQPVASEVKWSEVRLFTRDSQRRIYGLKASHFTSPWGKIVFQKRFCPKVKWSDDSLPLRLYFTLTSLWLQMMPFLTPPAAWLYHFTSLDSRRH